MKNTKKDLNCDENGFCEAPTSESTTMLSTKGNSKIKPKLIYFGDPMCSWCWGLTNHLEKVASHFKDEVEFELIMGGLRPGGGDLWDEQMKSFLKGHWQHVHEASGQEFNYGLFDLDTFNYDTEPACRAITTVKQIDKFKALDFYRNIQLNFYVENNDPNELHFYRPICDKLNIDYNKFSELYNSPKGRELVQKDFDTTKSFGVSGFPTILFRNDKATISIARGYATFENMKEKIETLLIS